MPLRSPAEIAGELKSLPGWTLVGTTTIEKTYDCGNFVRAMGFVQSVALLAERANHHPDIDVRWKTVRLALSTHSAGGLTEKDFSLAREIEKIA